MELKADITVVKENDAQLLVVPREEHISIELDDYFSFEKEGDQHKRRFRRGWNGVTHLYSKKTGRLPAGLLPYVQKFAQAYGYSIQVDPDLTVPQSVDKNQLVDFVRDFIRPYDGKGKPIDPYSYQYYAVYKALKHRRITLLSATSSGKSLIIYLLARILELSEELGNQRILITVPSKGLVTQLYNDFQEYADNDKKDWHIHQHVQRVSGDFDKTITKKIVISTYQSASKFYNMNEFGVWINDETHNGQSATIKNMGKKLVECPYRIGLTGTLNDSDLHQLEVQSVFGYIQRVIRAKDLQEQGKASQTQIYGIMLDHPPSARRMLKNVQAEEKKANPNAKPYETELRYLMECPLRNDYLVGLAKKLEGNTLMLSNRVDGHILPLVERLKEETNRPVFAIHGGVGANEREEIRQILENYDDAIIVASYGTMSTGISIKKLHNLVFALPMKAKIKILQSIGRLMRLHESKDLARIIDIGDDLSVGGRANFSMKHMRKRIETYFSEGWGIKFKTVKLTDRG